MKKFAIATAFLLVTCPAIAASDPAIPAWGRYEVWMGVSDWPALGDLQPLVSGGFDTTGLGLGGAIHAPLHRFDHSDLLIGIDGFIIGTDSNISGFIDDLMARHLYLGASLKWAFGEARNVHLDGGLGYHLVDMAEVSSEYFGVEHEVWETDRVGAFVGATWDIGAGHTGRRSGLSVALKVHFVDFGNVRDEDVLFTPLLGEDAGNLGGPIYLLQIGYSSR